MNLAQQPHTAMADALRAAGYEPPDAKLTAIAIDVWARYPGDAAAGARMGLMREALKGSLAWVLWERYDLRGVTATINTFLAEVAETIAAQRPETPVAKPAGGASQVLRDAHDAPARPTNKMPPGLSFGGRSGAGQVDRDNHGATARPALSLRELADKQAAAMAAKTRTEIKMSRLDTVIINGKPIGDLTPREALGWVSSRERDARFVRMLAANLPEDRPIREFIDGDLANELYSRAEASA